MNKVVKKIAAVALSGLLVASVFAGCSGGSAKDTYTVGICQAMQHPALDKATEGFNGQAGRQGDFQRAERLR